jgi:DMSO/TMAO reductase YedYZ molybdopterin-dependent catalytic subunit
MPALPPRDPAVRGRTVRGVILGVATALIAVGIAQLVAAFTSFQIGGPVDAVGELSINHVPPAIKNFAIREFGSSDKTALVWGIYCVLFIFAAFIGVLALRKLWYGLVGLAVFIAIGIYAAESLPTATPQDVLPALVGGAVGGLFLWRASDFARRGLAARSFGPQYAPVESSTAATPPETPEASEAPEAPDWQSWTPGPVSDRIYEPRPDRRRFLLASAGAGVAGLAAYGAGSWLAHNRNVTAAEHDLRLPRATVSAPPLPNGYDLKIPGLSPFITPNDSFYRVDTAIVLPEILPSSWQLRIHGMVARELTLSFADLIKRPLIEDYITLCCVSNWVGGPYIGNAKWLGASLRSLLREAGIKAGADQLLCTSSDGFTSGTPVQTAMDGRDALLAVAMNGTALPVAHGFPARLVIPGLYGYVSACKWITDIEVTTYAANSSYWAQRGWSQQAPIKTESRIDVPGPGASIKAGHRTAIAGVAWAQHKGIEAVEVKIGSGPWLEAQLSAVPDIDCWRQWVYNWDANVPRGSYVIQARATDKTGYTQTSLQEPPEPNGASGYPSVQVTVLA